MHRIVIRFLLIACILTCALSAQPRLIKDSVEDARRVRLTGQIHPMAKSESDLGPLDSSTILPAVTLVLQQTPEQQADLDLLLNTQQDPASPGYPPWLSPEQDSDRFGTSPDAIRRIPPSLGPPKLH